MDAKYFLNIKKFIAKNITLEIQIWISLNFNWKS